MQTKTCSICKKEKQLNEYDKKKNWYLSYCKECRKTKRKQYYKEHREEEIKRTKKYQKYHKEELKQKHKEYIERNKEKIKQYNKKWEFENKEYRNKYSIKLKKEKSKTDSLYRLKLKVRPMLFNSFKRNKHTKNEKSEKILGCNIDFFVNYLLQTFKNNYGYEWDGIEKVHIDHIKPLSTAKTRKEVIELCHYRNLQLLKAKDNLMKHNKLNWELLK